MRFIHYSAEPLNTVLSVSQYAARCSYEKPRGLWISAGDGEDGWRAWCESENFCLESLAHSTEISLTPDANILRLNDARGIDQLTREFGFVPDFYRGSGYERRAISWDKVAERYSGIIIAPYCWSRRLHERTGWYYGWDCASGCIWDAAAVQQLQPYEAERAAA